MVPFPSIAAQRPAICSASVNIVSAIQAGTSKRRATVNFPAATMLSLPQAAVDAFAESALFFEIAKLEVDV